MAGSVQPEEDQGQGRAYGSLQLLYKGMERRWRQTVLRGAQQQKKRKGTEAGTR